jgi:hypothetical protein
MLTAALADAVEKVRSTPSARNNRITMADFLNRSCAFEARLESILLVAPAQNLFFNSIGPTLPQSASAWDVRNREDRLPYTAIEDEGRI